VQNALNLNRDPANGSGLDTSGAGAFPPLPATVADVVATLGAGLVALSFPEGAMIYLPGLSSYSVIEDGQSVTLGYTAGYLPIGLEPVGLCACVVQVPRGRREAVRLD
jgi:hypothetical protein